MANLKTNKTAAGAQQYSAPGKAKELTKKLDKDIKLVHSDNMTRAEFKDKYGMSIIKAQNMIYAASAAERNEESGDTDTAAKDYERSISRRKPRDMAYGGMAKKKYNKGGYVNCGASVPGTQKK